MVNEFSVLFLIMNNDIHSKQVFTVSRWCVSSPNTQHYEQFIRQVAPSRQKHHIGTITQLTGNMTMITDYISWCRQWKRQQ